MKKIAILCVLTLSVGLGAGAASATKLAGNCFNDVTGNNGCSTALNSGDKTLGTQYSAWCNNGNGADCDFYTQTDIAKWNGSAYVAIAGSPFKKDHNSICANDNNPEGTDWQTVASGTYRVKSKLFKGTIAGGGTMVESDQDDNLKIP